MEIKFEEDMFIQHHVYVLNETSIYLFLYKWQGKMYIELKVPCASVLCGAKHPIFLYEKSRNLCKTNFFYLHCPSAPSVSGQPSH